MPAYNIHVYVACRSTVIIIIMLTYTLLMGEPRSFLIGLEVSHACSIMIIHNVSHCHDIAFLDVVGQYPIKI